MSFSDWLTLIALVTCVITHNGNNCVSDCKRSYLDIETNLINKAFQHLGVYQLLRSLGSFQYVSKIYILVFSNCFLLGIVHLVCTQNLPKTNISFPLIRQGVRNVSFSESFAYVLNGCFHDK